MSPRFGGIPTGIRLGGGRGGSCWLVPRTDTCHVCGYSTSAPNHVECEEAVEVGDLAIRVADFLNRSRLAPRLVNVIWEVRSQRRGHR